MVRLVADFTEPDALLFPGSGPALLLRCAPVVVRKSAIMVTSARTPRGPRFRKAPEAVAPTKHITARVSDLRIPTSPCPVYPSHNAVVPSQTSDR